jgi:ribulose-bisphosphate carboxylase large chain
LENTLSAERILATYVLETPYAIEGAAEILAGEQSTGTFIDIPGETQEIKERYRTQVVSVRPLGTVSTPTTGYDHKTITDAYHRAEVQVSIPFEMLGPSMNTLLASTMGNVYEIRQVSGLRLIDLDLPQGFTDAFAGPQFGIDGTRALIGDTEGRPIIGSVIKPSVGLTPEETADIVRELVQAGVDFIKDDELMANPPYCPLEDRVRAVMRVINDHAQQTGKKVMYAFCINDDMDAMLRHYETIVKAGGTCAQVTINQVGVTGVLRLRKEGALALHGHRAGWGMMTRNEMLGVGFRAYQKIWRLIGVDHLHVNGLDSKFWEPNESVVESIRACLNADFPKKPVMPVVGSAQWGGQAPMTYAQTGSLDLIYVAGGGIMGHPGGAAAGVRAIQQAWQAAVAGIALDDYARDHRELHESIKAFGKKATV